MGKRSGYWLAGAQHLFGRWRWFWWSLVTAPLWLIGVFILVRDGLMRPEYRNAYLLQFLPSPYWYWHWYVMAALLYVIVLLLFVARAANRVLVSEEKSRSRDKMQRYRRLLERSFATVGAPRDLSLDALRKTYELVPLQPNLIHPFEGSVEDVHEGEYGVIARGHAEDAKNFKALIATYRNDPDTRTKRRIIGIDGVAAEVSYLCFDGSAVRPHDGAWLSEKDRKVSFEVSRSRGLIVATVEDNHLYAIERETTGVNPNGVTNRTKLTGNLFKLRVRLIDTFGAILDDYEMMLSVSREPEFRIELLSAKYWIRFRLHELAVEGHNLLLAAYKITNKILGDSVAAFQSGETDVAAIHQREKDAQKKEEAPLAVQAKEWETRVAEFVGVHLSEKEKESFVNARPSIDDGLNRVRKQPFEFLRKTGDKSDQPNSYNWTLIDSLKARGEKLDRISSPH